VGDKKGSLLYTQPPEGVLIFQPLDGKQRWRCQVSIGSAELLPAEAIRDRIRASLGTEDQVALEISSMSLWQPTPGCVTRFARGRIFLAGDAAHVSVPTGGLGNNSGFAGIRNLAWKLAYVLRGVGPPSLLDTYEIEHRPIAQERIQFGVETTTHMRRMMLGHRRGDDVTAHIQATHQYADYDHLLRGSEVSSSLVAPNAGLAPHSNAAEFTPLVRNGRRAPHVWVNAEQTTSVLDWFGSTYVLLLGPQCDVSRWQSDVAKLSVAQDIDVRPLPTDLPIAPYEPDAVVLVRPDGVIAVCFRESDSHPSSAVTRYLPGDQPEH